MGLRDWSGSNKIQFSSFGLSISRTFEQFADREALVEVPTMGPRLRRTYQQLGRELQRVREILRENGEQKIIATVAGNTYPHLLWITAAWLEGRTLCPLNPDEGLERLQLRLKQLDEPVSLWFDRGAPLGIETLGATQMVVGNAPWVALEPALERNIDQPMTLIFTSGSTGYAKIVEQMPSQILANAQALIQHHHLNEKSVIATPLPIFHVNALNFSWICSLLTGGKLVLCERFNPMQLSEILMQERVQICSVVPHILQTLLERISTLAAETWTDLRYFVTAASALSPQLAAELVAKFPKRIVQGYGLSEAVNFSCTNPVDLDGAAYKMWMTAYERPSIGVALWGNDVLVVDENDQPLGPGQKGEVVMRGLNVMRGYRGDKEQKIFTNEMLHSGDTGFYEVDEAGRKFFFISGRSKDTAKRLGHTVSLVEIDDILSSWPQWGGRAIAVPFDHHVVGEELAIIVQYDPKQNVQQVPIDELKALLESRLPEYMRPRVIGTTAHAVRTASGKPIRWKFKPLLAKFHGQILGSRILDVGAID